MSDLPSSVEIFEVGPREGFQIEPGPIPTSDKIRLVEGLADTGLSRIQVCSLVDPKLVPGWADAEAVVSGIGVREKVEYSALWFDARGLGRAMALGEKLRHEGIIITSASDAFSLRNLNRSRAANIKAMRALTLHCLGEGVPVNRVDVMAAFGCNDQGEIPWSIVIQTIVEALEIAGDCETEITQLSLSDTMGRATPKKIERLIGEVRDRWPDVVISLHLHNTRGQAMANAYAGLRMGIRHFDSSVGGLGGCPFTGQVGGGGNLSTEEFVWMCEEMGIATGVTLDDLIEVARMAEEIVGHPLPSQLLR